MRWYGLGSSGSGQRPVAGSYEHGTEPSGSLKFCEILRQLSDWWLLKDSAPWKLVIPPYVWCLVWKQNILSSRKYGQRKEAKIESIIGMPQRSFLP
jgi:hypothetical protein